MTSVLQTSIEAFNRQSDVLPYGFPASIEEEAAERGFMGGLFDTVVSKIADAEESSAPEGTISLAAKRTRTAKHRGRKLTEAQRLELQKIEEQGQLMRRQYDEHPWAHHDVVIDQIEKRRWFWDTYRFEQDPMYFLAHARPWYHSPKAEQYLNEPPMDEGAVSAFKASVEKSEDVFLRIAWWQHPHIDQVMLRDHDVEYRYVRLYGTPEEGVIQLKALGVISQNAEVSFLDDAFHSEYLRVSVSDVNEFNIRRFPQLGAKPRFSKLERPALDL